MADQVDNISAGTQVVSRVEVLEKDNSLVHPVKRLAEAENRNDGEIL